MKKPVALLVCALILAAMVGGCTQQPAQSASSGPVSSAPAGEAESAAEQETFLFTDSAGREVTLPRSITRLSPAGGNAQAPLFAIAADLMVSVGAEWHPSAQAFLDPAYYNMPVFDFSAGLEGLNTEEIAAAGPQVVIDIGETTANLAEVLDGLSGQIGVPVVHIEATTETMGTAFRTLGELLGRVAEGEALAAYCEKTLAEARGIIDEVGDGKASLLYLSGDAGNRTALNGSAQAALLDLICDNAAVLDSPSQADAGSEVSMEQITLWDPAVILFAPESFYSKAGGNAAWKDLQAIQNGAYYEVPLGLYSWMDFPPSTNSLLGLQWALKLLYPEYANFDLYARAAEFYDLFYHSDLTPEQFDAFTANSIGKLQPEESGEPQTGDSSEAEDGGSSQTEDGSRSQTEDSSKSQPED